MGDSRPIDTGVKHARPLFVIAVAFAAACGRTTLGDALLDSTTTTTGTMMAVMTDRRAAGRAATMGATAGVAAHPAGRAGWNATGGNGNGDNFSGGNGGQSTGGRGGTSSGGSAGMTGTQEDASVMFLRRLPIRALTRIAPFHERRAIPSRGSNAALAMTVSGKRRRRIFLERRVQSPASKKPPLIFLCIPSCTTHTIALSRMAELNGASVQQSRPKTQMRRLRAARLDSARWDARHLGRVRGDVYGSTWLDVTRRD